MCDVCVSPCALGRVWAFKGMVRVSCHNNGEGRELLGVHEGHRRDREGYCCGHSGRLFWICDTQTPKNLENSFYFNVDNDLVYQPFYADFGPLSLGKTWKYITELEKLLGKDKYKSNKLYHYCSTDSAKAANAAYLMGAFQVVVLKRSAEEAFKPFQHLKFVPFRDASYGDCSYKCTVSPQRRRSWTACGGWSTPSDWAGSTTRPSTSTSTSTTRRWRTAT